MNDFDINQIGSFRNVVKESRNILKGARQYQKNWYWCLPFFAAYSLEIFFPSSLRDYIRSPSIAFFLLLGTKFYTGFYNPSINAAY